MSPRKYDLVTLRLAAELFQAGLSYSEVGKLFGYDGNLLRCAVIGAFPVLGRKIPGRPDSRSRDAVIISVRARLETIDHEIESAGEHHEVFARFKEILENWLEEEENKPPKPIKFFQARCARQAVVRRLRALGLGARVVGNLTGYPLGTVTKDILRLRGGQDSSEMPTEPAETYRMVLIEYAKFRYHQGFIEEYIEDTKWYLGLLEKYLKLPEILAYLLGVEENLRGFERIEVAPEHEPYLWLWQALAPSDLVPPVSRLRAERTVENVWRGFVASVERGEAPAPTNAREAAQIIATKIRAGRRENIWPVWRDEWSRSLDRARDLLDERERYVLDLRFGFGQRPTTLGSVGRQLDLTRERIRQIEIRALGSLRRTDEFRNLCHKIVPARLVVETIQKFADELVEAQETIRQLRVEVFEEAPAFGPEIDVLLKKVDELELSVRAANCLQNSGTEFVWQLVLKTEAEMLKTKNFGLKSLREIKETLFEIGLSLGRRLPKGNFPWNR